MVITTKNSPDNQSSNPQQGFLHFTHEKGMDPTILPPAP